jgi:hypothetical protein
MRHGAKCEAYGEPCKNPATKLIEVKDKNGVWRTMIFCDWCYQDLLRDCADEIASAEMEVRS